VQVQQHAKNERERITADQFVGFGVLGDAELRHPGSVPHRLEDDAFAKPRDTPRLRSGSLRRAM
jgi:hypothetical protein